MTQSKENRKKLSDKANRIIAWTALFVFPAFCQFMTEYVRIQSIAETFKYAASHFKIMIFGYILLLIIFAILCVACKRVGAAATILGLFCFSVAYGNYFKLLYRNAPAQFSDLVQVGEVFNMSKVNITPTLSIVVFFVTAAAIAALLYFVTLEIKSKWLRVCIPVGLAAVFLLYNSLVLYNDDLMKSVGYRKNMTDTKTFEDNSFYLSAFVEGKTVFTNEDYGYSEQKTQEIGNRLSKYDNSKCKKPDVVVVLVESWYELDNYAGLELSEDITPNLKRLKETCITGNHLAPTYGGGTADVEFEVLTGFGTDDGVVPATAYNAIVDEGFPNIAGYLDQCGYFTFALHSYENALYNRTEVYPRFGFNSFFYDKSFENPEKYGFYITDEDTFKKAEELYEENTADGKNVLMHVVSIQNHVPITEESVKNIKNPVSARMPGFTDEQNKVLSNVATMLRETDKAVGELFDYFSRVDRDVVLVVYGDHQGMALSEDGADLLKETGFMQENSDEELQKKLHEVPYIVWANYEDRPVETFGTIPSNMLLVKTLDAYDAARPVYFNYLLDTTTTYCGLNTGFPVDKNGNVSKMPTEEQGKEILERRIFEYDWVFGKKKLSDLLY
ncbi:MAG: LTA synthase family protein [Oscillospiraceae bacterium]